MTKENLVNKNSFKTGDRVRIVSGFHKHREGVVINHAYMDDLTVDVRIEGRAYFLGTNTIEHVKAESTMPGTEAFMRAAVKALTKVARKNRAFTTDDVWASLAKTHPAGFNVEPRVLGSLMLQAQKQGAIAATDRTLKSIRPECHKRPLRIWTSRIFVEK